MNHYDRSEHFVAPSPGKAAAASARSHDGQMALENFRKSREKRRLQ